MILKFKWAYVIGFAALSMIQIAKTAVTWRTSESSTHSALALIFCVLAVMFAERKSDERD